MKVLHIITSLNDGGAEGALYRYVAADQSFEHVVVTLRGEGKYAPKLKALGIEVLILNISGPLSFLKGLLKLAKLLKQERPSIVQTWMYHADLIGGVLARLLGFKVVWGIRNTFLGPQTSKRSTLVVAKLGAWLSHFIPEKIIACAYAARDFHVNYGYDEPKMEVIHNGYEFRDVDAIDLEFKGFKIGMVARFDPFKDHRNLFRALSKLLEKDSSWRCFLIGPGMNDANLKLMEWIKEFGLGSNIELLGPRDDVLNVMKALDVHVLSSKSEAFPNVIAEAMSVGTPCISTDVGDAKVIIGETGFIVPPSDSESLSAAIFNYLNLDAEKKAELSVAAKSKVRSQYSIQAQCEAYKNVYLEVLKPSKRS